MICSGAGLASQVAQVEVDIGGRRIENEDIEQLLIQAQDMIQPDGRTVLHALPAAIVETAGDGFEALIAVGEGRAESDAYNRLVLEAALPWREAADRCFSPSNAEAILQLPRFVR